MAYYNYRTEILSDKTMSIYAEAECIGYGTGESHQRIIEGAGGEIGYDDFKNPMPNQSGKIYADKVFINQKNNEIQGINFVDDKGQFVCSYIGMNYLDIKDSNKLDIETKTKEDAAFFKAQETTQVKDTQTGEDRYFFESVEDKFNQFGEEMNPKIEEVMQSYAEPSQGIKGIKI